MSYRKRIEEKVIDLPPEPKQKQTNAQNVKPTFDETKMTRQELRSILKAMDNDGFDNIMNDYIKEISNPDNVKETNQYLKEMQEKKDVPANVKLVQPKECFCIKSKKLYKNLSQKIYINICSFDGVQKPFATGENKDYWNVPFLLNKQRNDQDAKGNHVLVFDVVFHSEAIKKSEGEIRFKKLLCDSAVNGINDKLLKEKNERISSDYQIMTKMNYKGKEVSYINIHSLDKSEFANKMLPTQNYKTEVQKEIDELKGKFEEIKEEEDEREFDRIDIEKPNEFTNNTDVQNENVSIQQPKYSFKYTDEIELHNYFYDPNNQGIKPYSKLSIEIQTPLMDGLDKHTILDINSKLLIFKYKEIYELNLNLPCEVNVDKCSAKFDRGKKVLRVVCSIVNKNVEGNLTKLDPNIEEIYEENNKIVEKKGKIEEVKNEKEVIIEHQSSEINKEVNVIENNKENNKLEYLTNDKSETLKENNVDNKSNTCEKPKEVLEIKEPLTKEDKLNLKQTQTEVQKDNVRIEEITNETESKQISSDNTTIIKEEKNEKEVSVEPEVDDPQQPVPNINGKKEEVSKLIYMNFSCSLIFEIE